MTTPQNPSCKPFDCRTSAANARSPPPPRSPSPPPSPFKRLTRARRATLKPKRHVFRNGPAGAITFIHYDASMFANDLRSVVCRTCIYVYPDGTRCPLTASYGPSDTLKREKCKRHSRDGDIDLANRHDK